MSTDADTIESAAADAVPHICHGGHLDLISETASVAPMAETFLTAGQGHAAGDGRGVLAALRRLRGTGT